MTDATDPLYCPELWSLDPKLAHLNHGSFGAVPLPVLAEQQRWRERMDANPVGFFRRELQPALDAARLELARFLGADDDGVTFVPNATSGVAVVLAVFPLAAGDEVLVTDHGYGAVLVGAQKAAARVGASVLSVGIPLAAADDEIVDALLAAVTPRTRLLVIDQVASATARRFPVERICTLMRSRGVAVLVDAAHAPGLLPVQLDAFRPDFWVGNFHKWPCAPRATAGLYVAEQWRHLIGSFPVSWREDEGFPHSFLLPGTADSSAWLAAPAALRFFERLGWDAVRARNGALAAYGQRVIADALGADLSAMPVDFADDGVGMPMRLVPLAGLAPDKAAADAIRDRIADEFAIESVINVWGGQVMLRISAQLYNHQDEYERLGAALRAVL
ncbi:MAG: aminotransferase class V-fold PLP-dependent enzyme [Actinocrinis sp.]